ncbi:MAG: Gfo/Idh/MocA family oxidoreductase [Anaerolineae bacterium]|nr:Gfo/Idh/MocA family oxidoreductase [Candidatus Roseilinea sp.]MDW8448372.1 Gfo/Idh/MocA family oxidoreductase [Anaerolineae bacterium]
MTTGFALIGAGLFGERHAQAYSRHHAVDFVAVCDLNADRAQTIAAKYGARSWTTDYHDVLANPDVRAVSIATPDHLHREVAVACAEAGKHLLVEKPLATTVEDAEAIVAEARRAGVTLMVDFHNRVNPPMVQAREAIRRGDIGQPVYVYARLSNTTAVPTEMLKWAGHSSALWFLASHMIDVVRWMLDDEIVRVYAVSRDGILKHMGVDTADFHVATVEFRRGAVAVFEHAWILPRTHATVKDLKLEILGSAGAINIDASHNRTIEVYSAERASFPDVLAPPTGEHLTGFVLDSIAYFVDAVTRGAPVLATGEDGVAATRAICAIIASAQAGAPVNL